MTTQQYMQTIMRGPNSRSTETDEDKPVITNLVKAIWAHPYGKVLLITGGGVLALGCIGLLLRLLTWVKIGYIGFQKAGQ